MTSRPLPIVPSAASPAARTRGQGVTPLTPQQQSKVQYLRSAPVDGNTELHDGPASELPKFADELAKAFRTKAADLSPRQKVLLALADSVVGTHASTMRHPDGGVDAATAKGRFPLPADMATQRADAPIVPSPVDMHCLAAFMTAALDAANVLTRSADLSSELATCVATIWRPADGRNYNLRLPLSLQRHQVRIEVAQELGREFSTYFATLRPVNRDQDDFTP